MILVGCSFLRRLYGNLVVVAGKLMSFPVFGIQGASRVGKLR